jgi:hypothetical protein
MTGSPSREQLVEDLQAFAAELGETPTRTEMNDEGPHSSTPYYNEFGSWNDALEAAGLGTNHRNDVPDEELIEALRELDEELDRTPHFEDMAERGGFAPTTYVRRWGSWPEAKAAAGLDPATRTSRRVEREELIEALQELAGELGTAPTQEEMKELGRYSHRPYYRVWDSWEGALRAAGLDSERDHGTSEEELLRALRDLADELGRTPTFEQTNELGEYSVFPYLRAFGSYNAAVREAGLPINKAYGVVEDPVEYGAYWDRQRERALERDGWVCQDCGLFDDEHRERHGYGLDVHHLEKAREFEDRREAHELENLVALCRACHREWERERRST